MHHLDANLTSTLTSEYSHIDPTVTISHQNFECYNSLLPFVNLMAGACWLVPAGWYLLAGGSSVHSFPSAFSVSDPISCLDCICLLCSIFLLQLHLFSVSNPFSCFDCICFL